MDIIVNGLCGETNVNILIDTGASASLVSTRLIDQLNLLDSVNPTSTKIAGLSNQILPMDGEIRLQIVIAGTKTAHVFIVCNLITEDILAGNDILNEIGANIDIPNRTIHTIAGKSKFLTRPGKLTRRCKVKASKTVKIKANSVAHFRGKLQSGDKIAKNYEGVVFGYKKLAEETGICVENALAFSCQNIVPIRCINPMPYDVTIYKNRIVGFMEPVDCGESVRGVHKVSSYGEYDATVNIPRKFWAEPEEVTREKGKWEDIEELYKQLKVDEIDITSDLRTKLKDVLAEFSHCFSRNKFDLGLASFYEAQLHLKNDYQAKWVPSRQLAYKLRPHMDNELRNLMDTGQIEKCNYSLWNSCVFLVSKPGQGGSGGSSGLGGSGGSFRLVQDLRQVNNQTLPDQFELPKINTIMDKMSDCKYLTSLDFTKGFNQIRLNETSRPITAFGYEGERYQWATLPMGQTSSSSIFARAMSQLFSKLPFQALICFLDDLLIGSETPEEHIKRLRFVLSRLSWGNLKISPTKAQLMRKSVKFLGQIISEEGLRVDPKRTEAILKLKEPTSVKHLQKFLGTMNYNRGYIKGFSVIAEPLYKLLQKKTVFKWDEECQRAFDNLKKAITSSPVLAIPEYNDPHTSYEITIDSSKQGHAATLTQLINGERRVISYFSKTVAPHMKKLGASRLEFLGMYYAILHFRIYVEGVTSFVIKTDCKALLNIATLFKNEGSYMQRRLSELQSFKFKIVHVSGKSSDIQMADYLSRYPIEISTTEVSTQTSDDVIEPGVLKVKEQEDFDTKCKIARVLRVENDKGEEPVTIEEIKEDYKHDKILSEVIGWLETGNIPDKVEYGNKPAELCHYWQCANLLKWKNGILYRTWINPNDRKQDVEAIVVPCTLIERVLHTYHDGNCHAGPDTALEACRRKFYFYKQSKNFKMYCEACVTCARSKQPHSFKRAEMRPIFYSHFGQCVAIDYLEPSKTPTKRGHTALLTMVDMYSNYVVCKPVKSTGTEEAIKMIINEWILKFGVMSSLMHDLGPSFTSVLFKKVLKMFQIKDKHGTPWHSQTNGRAESFNKKINVCMRACLREDQWQDYDLWINYITFTMNCLKSTKTKFSANMLVFGRELLAPRDLFIQDDERLDLIRSEITDNDERKILAYNLYKNISELTRKATWNAGEKAKIAKSYYDKKCKGPYFEAGQMCLLLIQPTKHKFAPRFRGPYKIIEKLSNWNYIVDIEGTKKVTNISKMKLYKPNVYSESRKGDVAAVDSTPHVSQGVKNGRKPVQAVPSTSSSDSEDDYVIITRSRGKKRKLAQTTAKNRSATEENSSNKVVCPENVEASNRGSIDNTVVTSNNLEDSDTEISAEQTTLEAPGGGMDNDRSAEISADRASQQDSGSDTGSIVDRDPIITSTPIIGNDTGDTSTEFHDALQEPKSSLNSTKIKILPKPPDSGSRQRLDKLIFQGIDPDHRGITLADIEKHQKTRTPQRTMGLEDRRGKKLSFILPSIPKLKTKSTSEQVSGTEAKKAVKESGATSSEGSDNKSRYSLRKNPIKTHFFSSEVKGKGKSKK